MAWLLFEGMFFGLYMASVYKAIASGHLKDSVLTVAGAIGSVCNGSSRLIWATLQDKFGFKKIYTSLLVVQLITSLSIASCIDSPGLYTLMVGLAFTCEGGHFSTFPAACARIFGIQTGGQIFTIMFFAIPISSFASFTCV